MTTKNLFAPHAAILAALSTLDSRKGDDVRANSVICNAIGQMRLSSEHVKETVDALAVCAKTHKEVNGPYAGTMIDEIEKTVDMVGTNYVKSGNGVDKTAEDEVAGAALAAKTGDESFERNLAHG